MRRPLHHSLLTATPDTRPDRWIYVFHGIFGAGRNWRSVLQRLVAERPDWGAVLVDLREHGYSQGFEPPHTLEAAAGDVLELARRIHRPVGGILGHSFGGKVALTVARHRPPSLSSVWIVDSTPEAREPSGAAWRMIGVLRQHPGPFAGRSDGIDAVLQAGYPRPVAQWMATNLVEKEGVYHWRLDADTMEELMLDFFGTDAWDVIEAEDVRTQIHLLKATESSVLAGEALARAERAAERRANVHLHVVEGGHWLNADNPDALVSLLSEGL